MYDTSVSFSASNLFFVRAIFSFILSFGPFLHLCHLSETNLLNVFLVFYKPSFTFGFHSIYSFSLLFQIYLLCSITFFSTCQSYLFIQYTWPSLVCCFPLSILHCNFPPLFSIFSATASVTLDVFNFSSFYSNLCLHCAQWCYCSSAHFWSVHILSS